MLIFRHDTSVIGQWWREIDKFLLLLIILFFFLSVVLGLASSNFLAHKNDVSHFVLLPRQLIYVGISLSIIFFVSIVPFKWVQYGMIVLLIVSFVMLLLVFFMGTYVKGAKRWLDIGFTSVQPSEFFKPSFIFFLAYFMAKSKTLSLFPSYLFIGCILFLYIGLLLLQPDIGQILIMLSVFLAMIFISGMSFSWLIPSLVFLGLCMSYVYMNFEHVHYRMNVFFENFNFVDTAINVRQPEQTDIALQAILNGGWLGRGAGEGFYKSYLPDSYSDFIFALAIEEFGIVFSFFIIGLFLVFMMRVFSYACKAENVFVKFYLSGFLLLFCGQSLINMAVNVVIIPTKGVTLPILSYGGSSMISFSIMLGFVLSLTRHKKYVKSHSHVPVMFEPESVVKK